MPQYVITPWKWHAELLQVRREIYQLGKSATIDERRHAVDWIAAWKMRGNLPHAVESTAHLVDAILHHDATKNSTFSIRATYSAAFCRFVTGFCDIAQNTIGKRSMFDVAREIDMPASFIELRHEATHDELPSLQRLMQSAEMGLQWLWKYYWVKLDEEAPGAGKNVQPIGARLSDQDLIPKIRSMLNIFLSKRRQEIKSGSKNSSRTSASAVTCIELVRLCRGRRDRLKPLALALVEEKMLIPAGRSPGSSMDGAFAIWSNLMRRLAVHQKHFARVLLERLSLIVTQRSYLDLKLDSFREGVYRWVLHIFSSTDWMHARVRLVTLDLREVVVNECLMSLNSMSSLLAQELIAGGSLEFKEQWQPLLELMKERDTVISD